MFGLDFLSEDVVIFVEEDNILVEDVCVWGTGLKMDEFGLRADILLLSVKVKDGVVRTAEEIWLEELLRPGIRKLGLRTQLDTTLFSDGVSLPLQYLPRQVFPWLQKGQ